MADPVLLQPLVVTGRAPTAKRGGLKTTPPKADGQWNPITRPIDRVWFGGQWTPGIAEISGASTPYKWEELGGYGLAGAILIYRGHGLSHFSMKLRLYTVEHWNGWHKFRPLVTRPPRGKRPTSIDVAHPLLDELQIRSVVVEDVLVAEQTQDGEWTIEIKLIAFKLPKHALAKPEGGAAEAPLDPEDQMLADQEKQLGGMSQQLADLQAGAEIRRESTTVTGHKGMP